MRSGRRRLPGWGRSAEQGRAADDAFVLFLCRSAHSVLTVTGQRSLTHIGTCYPAEPNRAIASSLFFSSPLSSLLPGEKVELRIF